MLKNVLHSASFLALLAISSPLVAMEGIKEEVQEKETLSTLTAKFVAKQLDEQEIGLDVVTRIPTPCFSQVSRYVSPTSFKILWRVGTTNKNLRRPLCDSIESVTIKKKSAQFTIELFRNGKKFSELVLGSLEGCDFKYASISLNDHWTHGDLDDFSLLPIQTLKVENGCEGLIQEAQQQVLHLLGRLFPKESQKNVTLWPVLRSLDFTHLYMRENGIPFSTLLSECGFLKGVEELNLWGTYIGLEGITLLAQKSNFNNVWNLNLGNTCYGDDLTVLMDSDIFKNVIELNLSSNGIDNDGIKPITNGKFSLKKLSVCNNKIGDEGTDHLSKGKATETLTHLNLGSNPVGDPGVTTISKAPFIGNLEKIIFGSWPELITENSAQAIRDNGENLKIFEYKYKHPENLDDYNF